MAEKTAIAWCNHTWNPVTGCMKVSSGCDHCYAEGQAKRNTKTFGQWAPGSVRKRTSADNWLKVDKWNREAIATGERRRVFVASMADVFDNAWEPQDRADMWEVIRRCTGLDFLLLTKRPQNIAKMLPTDWGDGWPNVWLGTTTENQAEADRRVPHLLAVPAVIRFLSVEPLLGLVDLRRIALGSRMWVDALTGFHEATAGPGTVQACLDALPKLPQRTSAILWVIVGGESGHGARPMQRTWATNLLRQCKDTGTAAFFKQTGSNRNLSWPAGITGKGDDPAEWPQHLRIQEFPQSAAHVGRTAGVPC